jgi:galactokinase
MHLIDQITTIYKETFGHTPEHIARAPGRVNLLGEHVDYNDGFVLPAAIDRATYVAYSPTKAPHSTLLAADFNQQTTFSTESILTKTQIDSSPLPEWGLYPAGVMWSLMEENLSVPSMNAVFASNVSRGSGLSSSASVELAFAVAWQKLGGWTQSPMELALLSQKAENKYVGVNCGIMDQFASACGVAGNLLLPDCRFLTWRTLPVPENIFIVIADTLIRRELTTSGYNERRQACEDAVQVLSKDLPGIRALRDVSVDDFNRLCGQLPPLVEKRARHVVEEVERTQRAIPLLEQGRIAEFGQIMNECHISLRDMYEVSIPELNTMFEIAQSLPGCLGARLTGAGFGGCTVNLVEKSAVEFFVAELAKRYETKTRMKPRIYICQATDGAKVI